MKINISWQFLLFLTLFFAIAKLIDYINWSWWAITSPLWFPICFPLFIILIFTIIYIPIAFIKVLYRRNHKKWQNYQHHNLTKKKYEKTE